MITFSALINALIYGLTIGSILMLVSIGLSLTFGYLRILNFTHGLFYALGAYILFSIIVYTNNFLLGTIAAIITIIPFSLVIEKFLIRRLYGKSIDFTLIVTFAVLLIGVDLIKITWGVIPKPISEPLGIYLKLFGVDLSLYRILIIVMSLFIYIALWLFFSKTMVGKIILAGLSDKEGLEALGINVNKYFSITFLLGSMLAALGGTLYSPIITVYPYMGDDIILYCFAVVVLGGMGSLEGTLVGALIMGEVMAISGALWGPSAVVMAYIAMAIGLILKPIGLFGKE